MVEKVKKTVVSSHDWAQEQQRNEGYIKLERGFSTIPLPSIDVPFHSGRRYAIPSM